MDKYSVFHMHQYQIFPSSLISIQISDTSFILGLI